MATTFSDKYLSGFVSEHEYTAIASQVKAEIGRAHV